MNGVDKAYNIDMFNSVSEFGDFLLNILNISQILQHHIHITIINKFSSSPGMITSC